MVRLPRDAPPYFCIAAAPAAKASATDASGGQAAAAVKSMEYNAPVGCGSGVVTPEKQFLVDAGPLT